MTLDEAREHIGDGVVYRPYPGAKAEDGTLTTSSASTCSFAMPGPRTPRPLTRPTWSYWGQPRRERRSRGMGQRTDAILAYGYDLGGEDEWKVREVDEWGSLLPDAADWIPDPEEEDDYDLIGLAERQLLNASGFTETSEHGRKDYFARETAAKDALGVEFETYCSDEAPMYILAAKTLTVGRGRIQDAGAFLGLFGADDLREWDAKLASALQALGVTPVQDKPKWLLVSYWG